MRRTFASVTLVLALLCFDISKSLALDPPVSTSKEAMLPTAGVPANYRQLLAEYIATHNRYTVRDAQITKPYERSGGLFKGGSFTAFCVAVFRDNPLGTIVRDNWVLHFDDGQIKQAGMGMESCSDLSPFPELLRAIANRQPR